MCLSFSFTLPYTHSLYATLIKNRNKNNHELSQFIIIAINAYNHLRWLFDRGLLVIILHAMYLASYFPKNLPKRYQHKQGRFLCYFPNGIEYLYRRHGYKEVLRHNSRQFQ